MSQSMQIYSTQVSQLAANPDPLSADMFDSALPVQHTREFYSDENRGIYVGLWDTTSMREQAGPYEMEEFMVVLEGRADIALASGEMSHVVSDQGFVIPRGLDCQWQQHGYLKKLFVIVDNERLCPANQDVCDISVFSPQQKHRPYYNQAKSFAVYPFSAQQDVEITALSSGFAVVFCQQGQCQYDDISEATHRLKASEVMVIEDFKIAKFSCEPGSCGYLVVISDSI
ncbi:cupin domain-containing protein [Thalassotalea mangrovi]|uniref:DUF861 domain-containing protein n=1 Tax=Thalassotalea mangrovi TaxID=2572245 RepID=A0A4U1B8B2_9GAMM|nr:hypothetical protein [Thalassotalea mangrovi]TKB46726.1 hypothetical protein E8M12_03990 [Thalassotalea mangrovi]